MEKINISPYSILDYMTEGVAIIGFDWNYIFVNDVNAKQAGKTKEEMIGHNLLDVVPDVKDTRFFEIYKEVMETRIPQSFEDEYIMYNGQSLWYQARVTPVPEGVLIQVLDISQMKKIESELKRSESNYKSLFNNDTIALAHYQLIKDKDNQADDIIFLSANSKYFDVMELDERDLNGVSLFEVFPYFTNREEIISTFIKVAFNAEVDNSEIYLVKIDKWFSLFSYSPRYSEFITIFHDITEKKKTEIALRESEKRYSSLFSNKTTAIAHFKLIFDENNNPVDMIFVDVNDKYFEIMNLDKFSVKGLSIFDIFIELKESSSNSIAMYKDVALNGTELNLEYHSKVFNKWFSIFAFSPKQGEFIIIFDDITQKKNAEEKLQETQTKFSALFNNKTSGIASFKLVFDKDNAPVDLKYIDVNETYCSLLKCNKDIIGQNYLEYFPHAKNQNPNYFKILSEVALNSSEVYFDTYSEHFKTWFSIFAFSPAYGEVFFMINDISDRKKNEEELRISQNKYRTIANTLEIEKAKLEAIISSLPVGIGIGDGKGNLLSFNKVGLDLHGFSSEEEMYNRLAQYVDEFELYDMNGKLLEVNEWPLSLALTGYFVKDLEIRLHNKKDNTNKIISYTVSPIFNNNKELILIVYVMADITNIKKVEEELKESAENFRTMAENISQLAWMANESGSIFWFNKRWYDFTGTSFETVQGWGWKTVHHPDYVDSVVKKYIDAMNNGTPWEDTFPLKSKNGGYRWFLSRALPVRDKDGRIKRWFGTHTDITEQKQLEEDLSNALNNLTENQAKFQKAEELAHFGSFIFDIETEIIEASDEFWNIVGLKPAGNKLKWNELESVIHPEDYKKLIKLRKRGHIESISWETELKIIRPDGSLRYTYLYSSPEINEHGTVTRRFGAGLDITETTIAKFRLEEAYEEIQERLKEKEVLLRELYHRTKNNMQVISSLMGLKAAAVKSKEIGSIFKDMQNRIRAISLVHEKLYQSNNLSKVNLSSYIKDLVNLLLKSHSITNKINVHLELENIYVLIDIAVPCGLIITELVINSIKYGFPDDREGTISIHLSRVSEKAIKMIISDNGIGFDNSAIDENKTLGLQLFKNIVEGQLNGEIKLTCEQGVCWEITFCDVLYDERV